MSLMLAILATAPALAPSGELPTTAKLAATFGAVALAAPGGTVAAGHVGVFSDGLHHLYVTAALPAGMGSIFIDSDGSVIATNALALILELNQDV